MISLNHEIIIWITIRNYIKSGVCIECRTYFDIWLEGYRMNKENEVKEKGLETKPVQFYINSDLKKRLKTYCVVNDENMTSVLTKVLDTFLVSEGY